MKKNILLALLLFPFLTFSQVSYEKRVEYAVKDGYGNEEIYEFGNKGLIMCSKKDELVKNMAEWKYDFLDTDLNLVKSNSVLVNKKYYLDETFNSDKISHTLFKHRKGEFSIVSVDANKMEITKIDGIFPNKLRVWDMTIIGDYAVFDAQIKKNSFLMSVNWKTGKTKLIPIIIEGYKNKNIYIQNFQVLKETNEIFVYIKAKDSKRENQLYVMKLNKKGEKENIFNLSKDITQNITSVSASNISKNEYIFTGTYSTKSTSMSEGLFFSKTHNNKLTFINFYNFLDLDNFLTYLPERKQKRIEKKHKKKSNKGIEHSINYNIADHDIIIQDDGYIFLGECYYPTYRQESYQTTSTVNGVATTTTNYRTVFDGYQYTHAVITKYDKNGKLIWDKTFEMRSSNKPFYVKRFISISEANKETVDLVYISWGTKIVTKSFDIKTGTIVKEHFSEIMETTHDGDKSKRAFSNIDYWYDNYFIAYGEQKIKNKTNSKAKRKRKIYFINKIKY